jgi:hypothetical protein
VSVPNEIELLLACARRRMQQRDNARAAAAIAAGVDWDVVERAAHAHGLAPLLHLHLSGAGVAVPAPAAAALAGRAAKIARRNLQLTATLARVLEAFAAAGIRTLPLKGPLLAQRLYGSIALRRMLDLDLLVAPREFDAAVRILETSGFRAETPFPPGFEPLAARLMQDVSLISAETGERIELHRYLLPPTGGRAVTMDAVEPYLRTTTWMGIETIELSPDALFVYLCQHGASHGWERLEWLAAVGELRRAGAVSDAAGLMKIAGVLGGVRVVRAAEVLVDLLVEAKPVPRPGDRGVARATALVLRNLSRQPAAGRAPRRDLHMFAFLTDRNWSARVRRAGVMLTRPSDRDVAFVRLPRPVWLLYRVLRPLRLALHYAARRAGRFSALGRGRSKH